MEALVIDVQRHFSDSCNELWNNKCVSLTESQVEAYPDLTIQLDGVELVMSSRDYILLGSPLATSANQAAWAYVMVALQEAVALSLAIRRCATIISYLIWSRKIGWGKVSGSAAILLPILNFSRVLGGKKKKYIGFTERVPFPPAIFYLL